MRYSLFLIALVSLPLAAQTPSFINDREGESYFTGKATERRIQEALAEVDGKEIISIYRSSLSAFTESNVCSYGLNRLMTQGLRKVRPTFKDLPGAIHFLRKQNEIDDVVLKILLEADTTVNTKLDLPKDKQSLRLPKDKKQVNEMVDLIATFQTRFLNAACFDEAYRNLVSEIEKINANVGADELEALFVAAHERKVLTSSLYVSLEQARVNELDSNWMTLKSYGQKIRSLRANKPLRDAGEKSDFVTDSFSKKENLSRRMRLMESYSDFQIMLMAEVIRKLRMHLEADRAEILIYRRDVLQDTIILEPMERFRMALKLLRKENAKLALNHYFNGRQPDYMDLMSAAYEVSIIPSTELAEVASLEEIWNPKKTFWDKAQSWIRGAGNIATILLPPPFGFIPALGIVVIEMTTKKNDSTNGNDPTSLF